MARSSLPKLDDLSAADLTQLISNAEMMRSERRQSEKTRLLDEFHKMAADRGSTLDEVVGRGSSGRRKRSDAGVKLKPKYRGPGGETYTGRGPTPKWLKELEAKGHKREKFLAKT
jgi:DNA-binding protein H-NS